MCVNYNTLVLLLERVVIGANKPHLRPNKWESLLGVQLGGICLKDQQIIHTQARLFITEEHH